MPTNGRQHVLQRQTGTPRRNDEPLPLVFEYLPASPSRQRTHICDGGPDSRPDHQQSILDKRGNDAVGRVGVDLQFLAERSNGREPVAGAQLAANDGTGDRVDHLLVDWQSRPEGYAKGQHDEVYYLD